MFYGRSVILMWMTVLMGGVYTMENPHNSLIAHHPRYSWMVRRLLDAGIKVASSHQCRAVMVWCSRFKFLPQHLVVV